MFPVLLSCVRGLTVHYKQTILSQRSLKASKYIIACLFPRAHSSFNFTLLYFKFGQSFRKRLSDIIRQKWRQQFLLLLSPNLKSSLVSFVRLLMVIFIFVLVYMYTRVYLFPYIYVHISIRIDMSIYVCESICTCVHMHTHIYLKVYIY
jgi:hypothetical protein